MNVLPEMVAKNTTAETVAQMEIKMNTEIVAVIKSEINGENVNSVNARGIHEYLEVKTPFATWIKRAIEKYDFVENQDYAISKNGNGANAFIDYMVTMDMAKELCMLENNPKGKETRKYFINVEKMAQQPKILTIQEQIVLIARGNQEIDSRVTLLEQTKRLEAWQEKALQDAKNQKVYSFGVKDPEQISKLHRAVWRYVKRTYSLPRYNELPAIKFDEAVKAINNLTLMDLVA
jgi:phage anti-repressor protein